MRAGELTDDEIRDLLARRGVDRALRRDLETELSWRAHNGRHGPVRPSFEYLPAWLLASASSERR